MHAKRSSPGHRAGNALLKFPARWGGVFSTVVWAETVAAGVLFEILPSKRALKGGEDINEHGALIRHREGIAVRPGFDYAIVTITVKGLVLRFVRGREDFRVDVAPQHSPASWQEVGSVLAFNGVVDQDGKKLRYYRLQDLGQLLKANLDRLEAMMSEDQFENLKSNQSPWKLIPL